MATKITAADVAEVSWTSTVERFIDDSDWLTDKHLPQLKALYAIAKSLDQGKFQAALISQFTLTQRTLLGKGPDVAPGTPDTPLDLFGNGDAWAPSTPNPADYEG